MTNERSKVDGLHLATGSHIKQTVSDCGCRTYHSNHTTQYFCGIIASILLICIIPTPPAAAFEKTAVRHVGNETPIAPLQETWPIHSHIRATDPIETMIDETPAFAEQLLWVFVDLFSQRQYEQAERVARRLVELLPDYEQPRYNLACVLARQQRVDEAFEALDAAVDRNWRYLQHMQIDPDLTLLRTDSRFADIERRLIKAQQIENDKFNVLRTTNLQNLSLEIQTLAPQIMQQFHVPGMSVAVVHNGNITWSGGFGVTDQESQIPVTEQTLFAVQAPYGLLASIALATHADLPLPELAAAFHDQQRLDRVRLRQHSRSIRLVAGGFRTPEVASRNIVSAHHPRYFPTATVDRFIQQEVALLEVIENSSFSELCRKQLLQPWQLASIQVVDEAEATRASLSSQQDSMIATGHSQLGTPVHKLGVKQQVAPTVLSTSKDLAQLLGLLLTSTQSDSSPAIPSRITQQIYRAAQRYPHMFRLRVTTNEHGLVVRVQLASDRFGSGCLMRWYPQANRGIVVLYNSELGPTAATRLADQTLGDIR